MQNPIPLDALSHLVKWTPIAYEVAKTDKMKVWMDYEDALMTLEMANSLYEKGLLLKAQRKTAGKWEVVFMAPKPVEVKGGGIVKKSRYRVDRRLG